MDKYRIHDRGSTATKALEVAWESLRKMYAKLPRAVIVIISGVERKNNSGHCSSSPVWHYRQNKRIYEIGINPELFQHHKKLLATIIHEAAHAILHNKNGGVNAKGYYHGRLFRDTCCNMLLACSFYNTRYGWINTYWENGQVPELYEPILKKLMTDLPMGVSGDKPNKIPGNKLPSSGHIRLACNCARRSIYVSSSVESKGGIYCVFCGKTFHRP